jgi:WD40 repeat protein
MAITSHNINIVSGSVDKSIKVWDTKTGGCIHTLYGHTKPVNSVAISSNNLKIVSGSDDSTVNIWCMETGNLLIKLLGHTGEVTSVTFSLNNLKIISGSSDSNIIGVSQPGVSIFYKNLMSK